MNKDTKISRNNLQWLMEQPLMIKMDLIKHHLSLIQCFVNEILDEETNQLAGQRYSHDDSQFSRYGYNPGSVRTGENKISVKVPRIINNETGEFQSLESYKLMRGQSPDHDQLMQAVLKGISTRDYAGIADYLGESFGLSKSSVSRHFIEATKEKLEEFENRSLKDQKIIAVFIDGKFLYGEQMMIALGITETGDKINLGIMQTSTENSQAIGQFLKGLIIRGLDFENGLLFIVDGSKGIKKAILEVFGTKALIQRCVWHKRENIMAPLAEQEKDWVKSTYHRALQQPTYKLAKAALMELVKKLERINRQSANSLLEGMEELLTLHKIEANDEFSISFNTTNCIESINSQIQKYVGRVKYWSSSDQRYRWVSTALIHIETKMRKVDNYKQLYKLKEKIAIFTDSKPFKISTKNGA